MLIFREWLGVLTLPGRHRFTPISWKVGSYVIFVFSYYTVSASHKLELALQQLNTQYKITHRAHPHTYPLTTHYVGH